MKTAHILLMNQAKLGADPLRYLDGGCSPDYGIPRVLEDEAGVEPGFSLFSSGRPLAGFRGWKCRPPTLLPATAEELPVQRILCVMGSAVDLAKPCS